MIGDDLFFLKHKILRVKQLKEILKNIPDNLYVSVGTYEDSESEEIKSEYRIVDLAIKPIGFLDSNEQYLKLYIEKYTGSGCMRFTSQE